MGDCDGFGKLLVGAHDDAGLRYVGAVEFGLTAPIRSALRLPLQQLTVPTSPFINLPRRRDATWLAPQLVARVTYQEVMSDGTLRHPCLRGLDAGHPAHDCRLPALTRP